VVGRSSDTALHYSPSWLKKKKRIVPLSANRMGWRIAAECCGSHAVVAMLVKYALNSKYFRQCHQQSTIRPASRWEPHTQRSSVHLLCVSLRHGGWNQKYNIWTHQTTGQISTSLMSISLVSWPKQVSSY
jgi:hypothetical protein